MCFLNRAYFLYYLMEVLISTFLGLRSVIKLCNHWEIVFTKYTISFINQSLISKLKLQAL